MANVSFDGSAKIISVTVEPVGGENSIDVKIDLYSDWKEWTLLSDNSKYEQAIRGVGGDPLPGSKALGDTYFLLNGWKIRPYEASHTMTVNGNLYCEDGTSPYVSTLGAYNVMVVSAVSQLVSATIQQLPEIEYASFNGGVTINTADGVAGTTYPQGTPAAPVNNLNDAKTIAVARGFTKFYIKGNLTIGATDDIQGYILHGEDKSTTMLTLTEGNLTTGATLENMRVTGPCGGRMNMLNCDLHDILHLCASGGDADIISCRLSGTIQLASIADQAFLFVDCRGDSTLDLDVNGCPADISFADWSGDVVLKNVTNNAQKISMDIDSGHITLDASCTITTEKSIIPRGNAKLTNNLPVGSVLALDRSGLLQPVMSQYGRTVFMDVNGRPGADNPSGLWQTPATTVTDGLLILEIYDCNILHFHSDMTIPATADLTALVIEAHSTFIHTLTFASGAITLNSIFRHAKLTGVMNGKATYDECLLTNISGIAGCMNGGMLDGTVALIDDAAHVFAMKEVRSLSQTPPNFDVNASGVNNVGFSGMVNIRNKTGIAEVNMHFDYGVVWIDATCTGGTIYLAGTGVLMADNSGPGCTVINNMIDPTAGGSLTSEQAIQLGKASKALKTSEFIALK